MATLHPLYVVRVSEILGERFSLRVCADTSLQAEKLAAEYLDSIGQGLTCRITSVKLASKKQRFAVSAS